MIILLFITTAECRYRGYGRIPLILLISYQEFEAILDNLIKHTKAEVIEIVHGVMSVPASKYYHRMIN